MRETMPACFFCCVMLLICGIVLFVSGIYALNYTPSPTPVLFSLHPAIWWGEFMGIIGAVYVSGHRAKRITSK